MKRVLLNADNEVVHIVCDDININDCVMAKAPDNVRVGYKLVNDQWEMPVDGIEAKVNALIKAVLTGDLTDLQALV